MRVAAPKDRDYLESLNLKALQKQRKREDGQSPREFYEQLQQEAEQGPLFDGYVLNAIAKFPDLPKVVAKWLGSFRIYVDVTTLDLKRIIDWVNADKTAPAALPKLTWEQAIEAQKKWHRETQGVSPPDTEYVTHDVVFSTGPYDFVEIKDPKDLATEGSLMGHCLNKPVYDYAGAVRSGKSRIFSLRDSKDRPHVTIEYVPETHRVDQCYGKQNKPPAPQYNAPLVKFFEHMKMLDGVLQLRGAKLPHSTWLDLARSDDEEIRSRVARNAEAPEDVLRELSEDDSWEVRMHVSENLNTPSDALENFIGGDDAGFSQAALGSPKAPERLLRWHADDRDDIVRHIIAGNPATPVDVLEKLAKDPEAYVRDAASKNLKAKTAIATTKLRSVIVALAALQRRTAAAKDRDYLESLNLKALQKQRKREDGQSPREFYEALQQEAKEGPLFGLDVLRTIEHLPELPKVVSKWLGNLKDFKDVDARDLNLIIDWVNGDKTATQELSRLTWDQAVAAQKYWHEHEFKVQETGDYKTHDVVFSTDGYDFVEIKDQDDLVTEGRLMGHCVGNPEYWQAVKSGGSTIYSLRDSKDRPHVTIEYDNDTSLVIQCFGKQNNAPSPKYNSALVRFFDHMHISDGILHLDMQIPKDRLRALMNHGSSSVRAQIASRSDIDVDLLEILANDEDSSYSIRRNIARNPKSTTEILNQLLRHSKESDVADLVLLHPNCDESTMEIIVNSASDTTRTSLARRPNVPMSILTQLATDKIARVRASVAHNGKTTVDLLRMLADDESHDVRIAVASNDNTPISVLKELAADTSSYVLLALVRRSNIPASVLNVVAETAMKYGFTGVCHSLSRNSNVDGGTLDRLADADDIKVQLAVARNQSTLGSTLHRLYKMPHNSLVGHMIAQGIVANPNAPEALLIDIASDPASDYSMLRAIAQHQNSTPAVHRVIRGRKPTY